MNAVWGLTWKELIRKRVTLMTILMTVVFLVAYWFIADAIAGEHQVYANDSSNDLFIKMVSGVMVLTLGFSLERLPSPFSDFWICCCSNRRSGAGVLQSVLARPIPRWKWFMGRWLGFVSYGALYAFLLFFSIIVICWIETGVLFQIFVLLKAYLLFTAVVPLLVSLTMLGSCFLSPLGNGISMTMLFGMGWLGSMLGRFMEMGRIQLEGIKTLETITGLIKLFMPADALQQRMLSELFSISELGGLINLGRELSYVFSINGAPTNSFLVYCAIYTIILLAVGLFVMTRKDF